MALVQRVGKKKKIYIYIQLMRCGPSTGLLSTESTEQTISWELTVAEDTPIGKIVLRYNKEPTTTWEFGGDEIGRHLELSFGL